MVDRDETAQRREHQEISYTIKTAQKVPPQVYVVRSKNDLYDPKWTLARA